MSNLMKILPVGAEFFHADGQRERERERDRQTDRQTDRQDETNIRFSQFCEGAYKWYYTKGLDRNKTVFSQMPEISKFYSNSRKI
jgi:hypothetical protein